ncbi:hypothetical protein KW785_01735 [Candidatus Parcubacteria bacterium]|nr:hypothetical protein [Candidatus Parcubacteria bacterium]
MRSLATLFCFLLVLLTPYWMYFPAIILCIILFPLYGEGIILGLLIDVLYGRPHLGLVLDFPFGMIAGVCVLLAAPIREHLRFNA